MLKEVASIIIEVFIVIVVIWKGQKFDVSSAEVKKYVIFFFLEFWDHVRKLQLQLLCESHFPNNFNDFGSMCDAEIQSHCAQVGVFLRGLPIRGGK